MSHNAEIDAISTHNVYRITDDLRYQGAPCFCPASRTHSILDTRPTHRPDRDQTESEAEHG